MTVFFTKEVIASRINTIEVQSKATCIPHSGALCIAHVSKEDFNRHAVYILVANSRHILHFQIHIFFVVNFIKIIIIFINILLIYTN